MMEVRLRRSRTARTHYTCDLFDASEEHEQAHQWYPIVHLVSNFPREYYFGNLYLQELLVL